MVSYNSKCAINVKLFLIFRLQVKLTSHILIKIRLLLFWQLYVCCWARKVYFVFRFDSTICSWVSIIKRVKGSNCGSLSYSKQLQSTFVEHLKFKQTFMLVVVLQYRFWARYLLIKMPQVYVILFFVDLEIKRVAQFIIVTNRLKGPLYFALWSKHGKGNKIQWIDLCPWLIKPPDNKYTL